MTGAISDGRQTGVRRQGRRRARQPVPRARRVEVPLTDEEYAVIEAAARRAGLARRAYIAQAVLAAAANWSPLGGRESLRRTLIELMRAAGLVRRMARNPSPGMMAGKLGLAAERARVEQARREYGQFALMHDLTNCLRIGDITAFTDEGPVRIEVKTNGIHSRRELSPSIDPRVTLRQEPTERYPRGNPVGNPGTRPRVYHGRGAEAGRAGFVS